jgi:hypothetical protein
LSGGLSIIDVLRNSKEDEYSTGWAAIANGKFPVSEQRSNKNVKFFRYKNVFSGLRKRIKPLK